MPAIVRCPACQQKFLPVPQVEPLLIPDSSQPPSVATKPCPYCGERILTEARKCRHCGELLDAELRDAAEARQGARRPMVIQNTATAIVGGGYRPSLLLSYLGFLIICLCLVFVGVLIAWVYSGPIGTFLVYLVIVLLFVGTPIYLGLGIWRLLRGV